MVGLWHWVSQMIDVLVFFFAVDGDKEKQPWSWIRRDDFQVSGSNLQS
jgi:hypothetical protein